MSGHSKWSTIKRKKGVNDAKRGKIFTQLIREITIASKAGGGDADANPRLRLAVEKARGQNMPKENIERAIRRGTGELEGESYDEIRYEGYGPAGVAVIVDTLTDLVFDRDSVDADALIEAAIEADADDVVDDDDAIEVRTSPEAFERVRDALRESGFETASSEIAMHPQTSVVLTGREAESMLKLLEALDGHDDVRQVYANFDISDEEMSRVAAAS